MIKVENNRKVCVYGVCFSGVDELKKVALSNITFEENSANITLTMV